MVHQPIQVFVGEANVATTVEEDISITDRWPAFPSRIRRRSGIDVGCYGFALVGSDFQLQALIDDTAGLEPIEALQILILESAKRAVHDGAGATHDVGKAASVRERARDVEGEAPIFEKRGLGAARLDALGAAARPAQIGTIAEIIEHIAPSARSLLDSGRFYCGAGRKSKIV